MDVVSGGEMERAWLAGTPMQDIVFAGVGKTEAEQRAALDGRFSPLLDDAERLGARDIESRGPVGLFNVESESELEVLARVAAELGVVARACLRVNPDVDARTHEYTTTGLEENKFGVSWRRVPEIFEAFRDVASVELVGLHVHIGSPVREIEPYESAVKVLLRLVDTLEAEGHAIKVLDLGGGWPMNYTDGQSHGIEPFAEALIPLLEERAKNGLQIVLEPGRSILANAGVLLTRVQHVKVGRAKTFVICDAGMHTLIRPAFYRAFHFAWPAQVEARHVPSAAAEQIDLPGLVPSDIVGPICETGDFLARGRNLPPVQARRSHRRVLGRRLRHVHELELQRPWTIRGGPGGREARGRHQRAAEALDAARDRDNSSGVVVRRSDFRFRISNVEFSIAPHLNRLGAPASLSFPFSPTSRVGGSPVVSSLARGADPLSPTTTEVLQSPRCSATDIEQ